MGKKEENIAAVLMTADGQVRMEIVPNTLQALHEAVGGYIETLNLHAFGYHLLMILDEEGKLKGKPINRNATDLARSFGWRTGDIIVGDVLLVGDGGEEFASLPEDVRNHVASLFVTAASSTAKSEAKRTPGSWYHKATGCGGQGLVIAEDTGANVAVAYREEDGPLLAAAPDLLAACEAVLMRLDLEPVAAVFPCSAMRDDIRAAIAKAKGQ